MLTHRANGHETQLCCNKAAGQSWNLVLVSASWSLGRSSTGRLVRGSLSGFRASVQKQTMERRRLLFHNQLQQQARTGLQTSSLGHALTDTPVPTRPGVLPSLSGSSVSNQKLCGWDVLRDGAAERIVSAGSD